MCVRIIIFFFCVFFISIIKINIHIYTETYNISHKNKHKKQRQRQKKHNNDHLSAYDLQQAEDQNAPVNPPRQDEMQVL